MDLRHLRRETRTALELAIVAQAPSDLVNRLAMATGLLEALGELPADAAQVVALAPEVSSRSRQSLEAWQGWRHEHLEPRLPRG
jgi:hypothetical protein